MMLKWIGEIRNMNFFLVCYTIFSWSDKDKLRWKLIRRYFRGMDDAGEDGRSWYVQNKLRTWRQRKDRAGAYRDVTGRLESSTFLLPRSPVRKINCVVRIFCIIFSLNRWNWNKNYKLSNCFSQRFMGQRKFQMEHGELKQMTSWGTGWNKRI
jgi:hypothetical protein